MHYDSFFTLSGSDSYHNQNIHTVIFAVYQYTFKRGRYSHHTEVSDFSLKFLLFSADWWDRKGCRLSDFFIIFLNGSILYPNLSSLYHLKLNKFCNKILPNWKHFFTAMYRKAKDVGIIGIEIYFPRQYVSQAELGKMTSFRQNI